MRIVMRIEGRILQKNDSFFTLGSGLPAGVYIVKIVYDDNQVFTEKVNVK